MDGKTDRALPYAPIRKDPRFQYYLFSRTENHWCDHTTKCAFMESVYSYHLRETAKDLGKSLDEARNHVNAVHLLDCWPVNLTEKFRKHVEEKCPGMQIFYIAAGDTGTKQINDTDMHKPAKDQMRKSCEAWFKSKDDFYLVTKLNSGGIDSATFHGNLKALRSKTNEHSANYIIDCTHSGNCTRSSPQQAERLNMM